MKRGRFVALLGLCVVAAVATTALSSSAAARPAPSSAARASAQQLRLPLVATKQMRALAKRAIAGIRRLQATGNGVICIGVDANTSGTSSTSTQVCTITGSVGVCVEVSTKQTANQTCNFTQPANVEDPRANVAVAVQVILQRKGGPSGSQSGTQTVNTTQQNTTKPNLSFVTQILKQSLGHSARNQDSEVSDQAAAEKAGELLGVLPDFAPLVDQLESIEPAQEGDDTALPAARSGDVSQTQQSQQTVNVCQGGSVDCHSPTTMSSKNLSSAYQSLRQRERAKNANSIAQHQNALAGTCSTSSFGDKNMCSIVDQNTTDPGNNASGLVELYRQFQSGFNTGSLTQEQDPVFNNNGIDHDINQLSLGLLTEPRRNAIVTFQRARQVQRAKNADVVDQFQDPRTAKGPTSLQTGSTADTWFGRQFATQLQTTDGELVSNGQEQRLTYDGETTGSFDVLQRGTANGDTAENTCSGSSCHVIVLCSGGGEGEESEPSDCFSPGDFLALRRQ